MVHKQIAKKRATNSIVSSLGLLKPKQPQQKGKIERVQDMALVVAESRNNEIHRDLIYAARNNDLLRLDVLLKQPIDINYQSTQSEDFIGAKCTALHYAALNNNHEVITKLIANGADLFRTSHNGQTPLHVAVRKGHKESVSVMLTIPRAKELLAIKDNLGKTAMSYKK
jgi:ankyrin repeat protein